MTIMQKTTVTDKSRTTDNLAKPPSQWSEGNPKCFSLSALSSHIKPHYRRLSLVACQDQFDRLDAGDDDTLIISCNWLLWQKAAAEQRHCVYYELGLADWTDPDDLHTDLSLRANDWVYGGGKDLTLFRGVSLGKVFCGEMTMCLISYLRLTRSLTMLIKRYRPNEIEFFDLMNEYNVLDRTLRKMTLETVARENGVKFIDRAETPVPDNQTISESPVALRQHGFLIRTILTSYSIFMEAATSLRCMAKDKRRRLMVIVITNLAEPLVKNFPGGGLTPIFLARTLPKRPGLLWRCWRKGILLVAPKSAALMVDDRAHLDKIAADLEDALADPQSPTAEVVRCYAKEQIVRTGRLAKIAADVCAAEKLLDRYQPHRIIVDGERNPPTRFYVELAKARNIAIDHTWHSPLVPKNHKVDALGGDPLTKPMTTRCLTWGSIHESWLDAVDARQPRVRVGSPLSDRYRAKKPFAPRSGGKNALILQYTPNAGDLRGLNANMFIHFVNVVRLLRSHGYENVRLKLHPGPGRLKQDFFEAIARYFELDCPVFKTEPFEDSVAWADIIIGPVQTGALFETLAAGKPYHAFLMPPHGMDPSYYGDFPILSSVEELSQALDQPWRPESGNVLLNKLYSIDEFPSGSKRFWQVMNEDA